MILDRLCRGLLAGIALTFSLGGFAARNSPSRMASKAPTGKSTA